MIKLLNLELKYLEKKDGFAKQTFKKNQSKIEKGFREGKNCLLWISKNKYTSYPQKILTIIENIDKNGFIGKQFNLTGNKNYYSQNGSMGFDDMNIIDFNVFILGKREMKRYKNELIVRTLEMEK